ncbi:peptidyl-prolyl cis-trans isomerase SurA [Bryocella elongata]|uniref:Peptidyl-prolyl cis-trans isomerase SurA n=2 Tax=Bryocella elongata TaxID=863522 RepID=A0A1H5ZBW6_9BACT|nr:peptidyl-prolyl cis-trans isomerase SurA [Bryocella elongata]
MGGAERGLGTSKLLVAASLVATLAVAPAIWAQQSGGFQPPAFGQQQKLQVPTLPKPQAITPNGEVVEDVIARVNDQIITRSEYERAQQQLIEDGNRAHAPEADIEDRLHNLLRDMIDQQLLLSKGKELGITGEAELTRQLDEIRKQNHLDSMEALEKAATQQGVSYEDFKQRIKDQVVSQQVVREEVGRRINMTHSQELAYYNAHQKDFETPEQVHLSEILIPTPDNATDAQVGTAQAKADAIAAQLKGGASFTDVAKANSGGPTASAGGDLGDFKRGTLGTVLENATFSLPVGGVTAPIRTRQGFVILRVDSHQNEGVAPLEKIEPQVQEALYLDALQPALRAYLTKSRQDAYVEIASGFTDTGAVKKASGRPDVSFTAYKPPAIKKKTLKKQRLEQTKAAQAQAALASAREKVAEKQAEKAATQAAKVSGGKNADRPVKPKRIRKEKIRFGEAPQNALPKAAGETAVENAGAPIQGQAPGTAMAPTQAVTTISTGTGVEVNNGDEDAQVDEAPKKKSRYTSRESEAEEKKAEKNLTKAEVKATTRPTAATPQESVTEKVQAKPLGLNGDTVAKKKVKRKKGDPKNRLQEKPKEEAPAPPEPTVNPTLAKTPVAPASQGSTPPSSDTTTVPPTTTGAPGSNPAGQPIPKTTSATPPPSTF